MDLCTALGAELTSPDLGRFYRRNGFKGKIAATDRCFWLSHDTTILAAAKISKLDGTHTLVLRGVWVAKECRGQGLGTKLLRQVLADPHLSSSPLFCFSYPEAVNMYLRLGFRPCEKQTTPEKLWQQRIRFERRGTDTVLLKFKNSA